MAPLLVPVVSFIGGVIVSFLKSYAFRVIIYKTLLIGAMLVLLPRLVSWFLSTSSRNLIDYFITSVAPGFTTFFQGSIYADLTGVGAWLGGCLCLDQVIVIIITAHTSCLSIRIGKRVFNFLRTFQFKYTQMGLPGM